MKTISVNDYRFKMVLTSEEDGYYYTHRRYDLFFQDIKIASDIPSIKRCYYKAYEYTLKLENKN